MIKTKVVIYLRLSKEDGDDESVSISNQRRILTEYAKQHDMEIVEEYIDDGWSGFTMDRPEFNKLKNKLNNDEIHTILVKDLSRLGRHNAKVQLFLENILEDGKRVIAVGEGYDTYKPETHQYLGVHTWVNENFIRETSRKVKDTIRTLQKNGKFICNVPYGYIKDEFDRAEYRIDETIAPYVKQIFDLYIEGYGIKMLARKLTEMNVPTPNMVRKMQIEAKGKVFKGKANTVWDLKVIHRMLQNEFYIGTLTLRKTKRRAINGKQVEIPLEERQIFKYAHDPIIDAATFNLVQDLIKSRSVNKFRGKKNQGRANIFSGMLYCADCGKLLTCASGKDGNTRYICKTYNIVGVAGCKSHAITEREIREVLIEFLEYCSDNLTNVIEDLNNVIQAEIQAKTDCDNNILQLTNRIQDVKKAISILIEQKMRATMKDPSMIDVIDKMYDEALNDKYKEVQILEKQLNDQHQIELNEVEMKDNINSALSLMYEIIHSKTLTKKQVMMMVDKIVVYEDTGVDIYLKGDLHKLANNYFKVSDNKLNKTKKLTYDFIMSKPDGFNTGEGHVYMREHGLVISYKKFSEFLKGELLSQGYIKIKPQNRGYRLIASEEELRAKLLPNNVAGIASGQGHNNEVFELLISINNWISGIKTFSGKKKLF